MYFMTTFYEFIRSRVDDGNYYYILTKYFCGNNKFKTTSQLKLIIEKEDVEIMKLIEKEWRYNNRVLRIIAENNKIK